MTLQADATNGRRAGGGVFDAASLTRRPRGLLMTRHPIEGCVKQDEIKDAVKFILLVAFIFTVAGILVELFVVR